MAVSALARQATLTPLASRPRTAAAPVRRVAARAEALPSKPVAPKGVTEPPVQPIAPKPKFGFVENAEVTNSRAAMLGFFGILAVEALTGKGIFEMLGFKVGQGLGFEF